MGSREYETQDGKLERVNNKRGFYNIIPSEAILSKKTTIFGETIQVTGRSCEISNDVMTDVEPTGDFLSDRLLFKFNGTIKLTEVCRTSNGVVTSNWTSEDEIYIELPISCSITSEQIKCGALKLTSNKVVTVEVGPTRMKKITKQKVGEKTVRITWKIFRGNFTFPNQLNNHPNTTLGLSSFYWILIGAVSGAVLIIAIISGICGYKLRNRNSDTETAKLPPGGTTFVHNEIQINPESRFKFGSFKRKRNNADKIEEIPEKAIKIKELEGVLTLGEQMALEAKESA